MKVIPLEQAKDQFAAVCEEVMQGEIIRLQATDGSEIELTRIPKIPDLPAFTDEELRAGYDDPEWARFENNCGKASS